MANPYHDANGKFCSRGEMQSAIDDAAKTGKLDVYFQLRTDLEAADKDPKISYEQFKESTPPINLKTLESVLESYGTEKFVNSIEYTKDGIELPGLGVAKYVGEDGGGIGETNNIGVIFDINGNLYRVQGHYSSWDGTDWSSPYFSRVQRSLKQRVEFDFIPSED